MKLTRSEDTGGDLIVAVRRPGWLLAAAAAVLGINHPVTATTVTTCLLRPVTLTDFRKVLYSNQDIAGWLLRMQAHQTVEHLVSLGSLGSLRPKQRLERFLAGLIADSRAGTDESSIIRPALKHREIAQAIGITPQHLSKVLREPESEKVLIRDRGWIRVPRASRIRRLPSF